jgi:hypothetical protein
MRPQLLFVVELIAVSVLMLRACLKCRFPPVNWQTDKIAQLIFMTAVCSGRAV